MAEEDPSTTVTILIKNLNHENDKVAKLSRKLLDKSTKSKRGMRVVLEDIVHPNEDVRRNAVVYLRAKRGFHAITYASFYEHTYLLLAIARNKEIPVRDIEALVEVSADNYLEGETIQALQDIAACLDFIRHRHRTADTLRGYVTEMLRMAPDLTRMGTYDGQIAEPLKRAIHASKNRSVDETKEIIEVRAMESSVRKVLSKIGRLVKNTFEKRPDLDFEHMSGNDVFAITRMKGFIDSATSKAISGKREEALKALTSYLDTTYAQYMEDSRPRVQEKVGSALTSIYIMGLVILKLTSYLMPQTAEDIYQRYFRGLESEPSVHVLPWPEPVMKLMA